MLSAKQHDYTSDLLFKKEHNLSAAAITPGTCQEWWRFLVPAFSRLAAAAAFLLHPHAHFLLALLTTDFSLRPCLSLGYFHPLGVWGWEGIW
jgi:hypothetical protein